MIPTNKIGRFSITNKDGVCCLNGQGIVWMSDDDKEKEDHQDAIEEMEGRVLIGGGGLFYVPQELAKKPEVTEIVIVEKSWEVRDLVWPYINQNKCELVIADLFEYLKTAEGFDYMYFDIHRDTSNYEYFETVVPLRKLAEKLIAPERILMWKEEEMDGLHNVGS